MQHAAVLVGLLASVGLAGCLQGGLDPEAPEAPAEPTILLGEQTGRGTVPLLWTGRELTAVADREAPCGPGNCERFGFDFQVPDGFWEANPGWLEVSIAWPMVEAWNWRAAPHLVVRVRDAAGTLVGEGEGSLASVVLLENAPPGRYAVEVAAGGPASDWRNTGWEHFRTTSYEGVVQVELVPQGPVRDLLPDLVVLEPMFLRIEEPPFADEIDRRVAQALGAKGCYRLEVIEQGARRCLRFQAAIANVGEGAFDMRLSFKEGVASYAGAGTYAQRIHRSDGSTYDLPAGPAAYHVSHEHVHYLDLVEFQVYEHDPATGMRGAALSDGRKAGWCSGDIGLARLGLPFTLRPYTIPWDCTLQRDTEAEWSMGIQPGWFDPYSASSEEQYVDLTGVPDGVYELVFRVNPSGSILETDRTDNEASAVFELSGDRVTVLSARGWR